MNGRVYDYNLGRFLSVDPLIQSPGNSQSINPYSYIMNNPLSGTDPTGYSSEPLEIIITCGNSGNPCGPSDSNNSDGTSSTRNREGSSDGSPTSNGMPPSNGSVNSMPSQVKQFDSIADLGSQGGISTERDSPSNRTQITNTSQTSGSIDIADSIAIFGTSAGIAQQTLQYKKDIKLDDRKKKSRLNPNTMKSNRFHSMLRWAKKAGQLGFAASIASRTDKLMQMRANPNISSGDMAWEYTDFAADMAIGTFGMLGGWPGIMVGGGYSYLDAEAPGGNLLKHGWNKIVGRKEHE